MPVIKALVLPPAFQLILALAGFLLLLLRWRRSGTALVTVSFITLYLFSIVPVSQALLVGLEIHPPLSDAISAGDRGAVVVLGGGRYPQAPEYNGDTVGVHTLERLRYAAGLAQRTDLPILVSGGTPHGEETPEAELMNRALEESLGRSARWRETKSRNTAENAVYSARILTENNIDNVFLVTHAAHMRRAGQAFRKAGLDVTPAPTGYGLYKLGRSTVPWFIPTLDALNGSATALYEYYGLLWYSIRY